jgi:integrase
VYIDDPLFKLVRTHADVTLAEAMGLMYLTAQRPGGALRLTEKMVVDSILSIKQNKTKTPLRIMVISEVEMLLTRIKERKALITPHSHLLVNEKGHPLSKSMVRGRFKKAKTAAAKKHPEMAEQIMAFWIRDLRAKAADDTSDLKGDSAAADLLGHADAHTTKRHYIRRGKRVAPTQ